MTFNLGYVARETSTNLRRNITLTLASILTVAVSLSLVGSALLLRQGVENATDRWKGGIEFIIFMNPDAEPEQIDSVRAALSDSPQVGEGNWIFFDHEDAYSEFRELFQNAPDMVESVSPEDLPTSFRVVPRDKEAELISELGNSFDKRPGVKEVVFAFETVKTMQRISGVLSYFILGIAVVLLCASTLLIINTIRIAMFARRREIEVMKLVGATNWFIRIPFMLEGLIQGLVGALFAVGAVHLLNRGFEGWLSRTEELQILQSFSVDAASVWQTSFVLLLVGILAGAIGSGVAVSRFLDV